MEDRGMMTASIQPAKFSSGKFGQFQEENDIMAFVNEYIPEADIEKYGIKEINKRFLSTGTSWTIDRERDIYLRNVAHGREEFRHQSTWTFYWHGELLVVKLDMVEGSGKRGEPGWSHYKLRRIDMPEHIRGKCSEIVGDLKEALTAYQLKGSPISRPASSE